MSNEIVKGSCLCGEIVYEIEGPFKTHKWGRSCTPCACDISASLHVIR